MPDFSRRLQAVGRSGYIILAMTIATVSSACFSGPTLYVYRAYQDPRRVHSSYYLREALVAAPDHASALQIVARTMTEAHPRWSGPLYVAPLGVCEERRQPGLIGAPVWIEKSASPATEGGAAEGRRGGQGSPGAVRPLGFSSTPSTTPPQ